MGQDTDQLTTTPADIEATRADLSRNLDELSDKVSPQRVIERRKDAAKKGITSVRDKVMGSTPSPGDTVGSAKDSAQSAVGTLGSATAGSPVTAGLVAFGAGMLLSALLPASDKETAAAQRVVDAAKEHGQPLIEDAKAMGKDLGESAAQAAQEVKAEAQDSVATVKQEGQSSVDQVKDQAPTS